MQLFILKDDDNKIMFCGNKAACLDWLVAGNNYLQSSCFVLQDFAGNTIKTFITKR